MSNGTTTSNQARTGANVWDAVIALIVIGALVVLAFKLIDKYGSDTEKITSVLGVAAPVLAAAFGVTLGYFSGNEKGKATGEKAGKQQALEKIRPHVEAIDSQLQPGAEAVGGQGALRSHVDQLKGAVDLL